MISLVLDRIRWRTTRGRVQKRATAFIHAHGELAFARAHEAVWIARSLNAQAEAKFWEAVAGEIARQIRRGALFARIMQSAGAERLSKRDVAIGATPPRPQAPQSPRGILRPVERAQGHRRLV